MFVAFYSRPRRRYRKHRGEFTANDLAAGAHRDRRHKSDQAGYLEPRQMLAGEPPELL